MKIEEIDRGIFEALRKAAVEHGYLPDKTNFQTQQAYEAAKDTLRDQVPTKSLVEIFGVGSPKDRGDKQDGAIYINRDVPTKGGIGAFGLVKFEKVGSGESATFNKFRYPDGNYDIMYSLRVLTSNTLMNRITMSILMNTLPSMGYMVAVDENGAEIEQGGFTVVQQGGSSDLGGKGHIEELHKYEVQDVWITDFKLIRQGVPQLKEVRSKLSITDSQDEDFEGVPV